mgnify:CR=1 FL=1
MAVIPSNDYISEFEKRLAANADVKIIYASNETDAMAVIRMEDETETYVVSAFNESIRGKEDFPGVMYRGLYLLNNKEIEFTADGNGKITYYDASDHHSGMQVELAQYELIPAVVAAKLLVEKTGGQEIRSDYHPNR